MKDSIRISAGSRVTLGRLYITINALYYYRFHDTFASDGYSTKNGINPVPITVGAFSDPKVIEAMGKIFQEYYTWVMEKYDGMFNPDEMVDPEIHVGFEFFGSEDSKWNKAIAFERLTS